MSFNNFARSDLKPSRSTRNVVEDGKDLIFKEANVTISVAQPAPRSRLPGPWDILCAVVLGIAVFAFVRAIIDARQAAQATPAIEATAGMISDIPANLLGPAFPAGKLIPDVSLKGQARESGSSGVNVATVTFSATPLDGCVGSADINYAAPGQTRSDHFQDKKESKLPCSPVVIASILLRLNPLEGAEENANFEQMTKMLEAAKRALIRVFGIPY